MSDEWVNVCVLCAARDRQTRLKFGHCCAWCADRFMQDIRDIPVLAAMAHASLTPGQGSGSMSVVYGPKEPLRLEALDPELAPVVMFDGEVVQVGKPQELFETPDHTFVGYFIGSPGMNVLPAHIEGASAHVNGEALFLGRSLSIPAGANVEIGIRPEFLKPVASGGIAVRILRVEDIGRQKILRCEAGQHRLAAILPEDAAVPSGHVRLSADPDHIHVYANSRRVRQA